MYSRMLVKLVEVMRQLLENSGWADSERVLYLSLKLKLDDLHDLLAKRRD